MTEGTPKKQLMWVWLGSDFEEGGEIQPLELVYVGTWGGKPHWAGNIAGSDGVEGLYFVEGESAFATREAAVDAVLGRMEHQWQRLSERMQRLRLFRAQASAGEEQG